MTWCAAEAKREAVTPSAGLDAHVYTYTDTYIIISRGGDLGRFGGRPLEAARSSTRSDGWVASGWASLWECRAARSRQGRALGEEWSAQEPSCSTAVR